MSGKRAKGRTHATGPAYVRIRRNAAAILARSERFDERRRRHDPAYRPLDGPATAIGAQADGPDGSTSVADVEHVERPIAPGDRSLGQTTHGAAGERHEPEYTPRGYMLTMGAGRVF